VAVLLEASLTGAEGSVATVFAWRKWHTSLTADLETISGLLGVGITATWKPLP